MQKGMSIIIPTLERQICLLDTVKDLLQQTFLVGEIIIVDQSKNRDDNLLALLEQQQLNGNISIHYYHVGFKGLPVARNFGALKSQHPIILYIDDDVKIPNNFLAEHSRAHEISEAAIVAGGIEEAYRKDNPMPTRPGYFNFWTATPIRDFNSKTDAWVASAPGGNFSIKRDVFRVIKGFDERLTLGAALYEETEFCLRASEAGFKVYFAPRARLTHLAHPTGGCRVDEVPDYTWALARNRMFLISRYLQWYHMPTAMLRLSMLVFSYFRTSWSLRVITRGLKGMVTGLSEAMQMPRVGNARDFSVKYERIFGSN